MRAFDYEKLKQALNLEENTKVTIKPISGGYKILVRGNTTKGNTPEVLNLAKAASRMYWFGDYKMRPKCMKCNTSTNDIHYHHIVYRSAGGEDDPDNLLPLCFSCHVGDNSVHSNKWSITDVVRVEKINELKDRYGIKHT